LLNENRRLFNFEKIGNKIYIIKSGLEEIFYFNKK